MFIFLNPIKDNLPFCFVILILFLFDLATGIAKAFYKKSFASEKLRKSVGKFIGYCALVFICAAIEFCFKRTGFVISACLFLIITEIFSIIENARIFIKIPTSLEKYLAEDIEDDETDDYNIKE